MSWLRPFWMWRSAVQQVKVEEITEEDAFECWLEHVAEARGKRTAELKKAWHPEAWLPNKVFVCNKTGEDIIVYVQRINTERTLKTLEGAAAGSPTGGSVSARLDFELSNHRLQKGIILAERQQEQQQQQQRRRRRQEQQQQQQGVQLQPQRKNVMFSVGGGARGAYITVMLKRDPKQLFCIEQEVPCGYRLVISEGTFLDPAATAPAAAAASTAPEEGEVGLVKRLRRLVGL